MFRVLVVEEKHGTYYYDVSTPEKWAAASVRLLGERLSNGYIYEPELRDYQYSISDEDRKLSELSLEEVRALPDAIREDVAAKYAKATEKIAGKTRAYEKDLAEYREIARIVETSDTSMVTVGRGRYERQEPRAWRFLEARSGYEYESVTIENAIDATKDED